MIKWNNPYITLKLPPTASNQEIKEAEKNLSKTVQLIPIVKQAREELTQNVNTIFPAFLTAVSEIVDVESDLKMLRRNNRRSPEMTDEIMKDAYEQLGISTNGNEGIEVVIDNSPLKKLTDPLKITSLLESSDSKQEPESENRIIPFQVDPKEGEALSVPKFIKE